ncbi:3'(2'),5'-bisphosphate nucleotidase CysQ [Blastochloris sulfoviridis]|uniref:3'(2'),5'-bisphosphate nucleotidase CysQ n=1 Tax=Blastochloris sulfoviridis TaxID=50712 RepID=A0A5M6I393_9HYPH|nr:3'(2'),5'-bisphosphate nucleotidase CysQ [Blastochloris sulfoviridis]KAA5602268.1 3'(2'),5'-bisphosphate nucleotidase CysQ [Blastochloris sulfoviridis]
MIESNGDCRVRDLDLLAALGALAVEAGRRIEAVCATGISAHLKADGSPVTEADRASEAILLAGLDALCPGVPVASEEAVAAGIVPAAADRLFLVDPLDGTKEFLAGNGEYAVNIALIERGRPVLGVVHAPVGGDTWLGLVGAGAWRAAAAPDGLVPRSAWQPVHCRPRPAVPTVALSRTHLDPETEQAVAALGPTTRLQLGSALKFAVVAEGRADLYLRLGMVREWDIAAGHALLIAAGGTVTAADGSPLIYGKAADGFAVTGFRATGAP